MTNVISTSHIDPESFHDCTSVTLLPTGLDLGGQTRITLWPHTHAWHLPTHNHLLAARRYQELLVAARAPFNVFDPWVHCGELSFTKMKAR